MNQPIYQTYDRFIIKYKKELYTPQVVVSLYRDKRYSPHVNPSSSLGADHLVKQDEEIVSL